MRKNKNRFTGYFLLSILVVTAFLLPTAWAQVTDAGTVLGTVADSSGAIVPGVSITLRDPESHAIDAHDSWNELGLGKWKQ